MEALRFADALGLALLVLVALACVAVARDQLSAVAILAGLLLRTGVVGVRYAGFQAFAREVDAKYFTEGSLWLVERGVGYYTHSGSARYQQYLAWLRSFGGMSVTGMELLGVAVWGVMGLLVIRLGRAMAGPEAPSWPIWVLALTPSGLLFTNGILRESYESLIFVLAVMTYWWLSRRLPQRYLQRGPIIGAAAEIGTGWVIHTAMGLAVPALLLINELASGLRRGKRRPYQVVLYGGLIAASLALGSLLGQAFAHLEQERSEVAGNAGSASYLIDLPDLGPLTLQSELVVGYGLYVTAPLPWQLRGPIDLVAFFESVTRTIAMVVALLARYRTALTIDLLLIAIAVQLAFSLGTINWGTSLRHHYVSMPALVLIAMMCGPWLQHGRERGTNGIVSASAERRERSEVTWTSSR